MPVPAAAEHSTPGVGIVVVARQRGYVPRHCRSCPTLLERTCYDNLLTQLANVLPSVVLDRTGPIPCNNLLLDRPVQFYLDQAMSISFNHSCLFNLAPATQRINTQFILFGLTTNAARRRA